MDEDSSSLTHYGIKGMKWGVRRSPEELARAAGRKISGSNAKAKLKSAASKLRSKKSSRPRDPDSDDVAAVKKSKATVAKNRGSTDALSNRELQSLVNRMNLEQQYSRLTASQKSPGRKFIESLFKDKKKLNQVSTAATPLLKKTKEGFDYLSAINELRQDLEKVKL